MQIIFESDELIDMAISAMEDMCADLTCGNDRMAQIDKAKADCYLGLLEGYDLDMLSTNEHYQRMVQIAEEHDIW